MTYILITSDASMQSLAHQLKMRLEQEGFSTWENVEGQSILGDRVALAEDSLRASSAIIVVGTTLQPVQRKLISEAQAQQKPIYSLRQMQDLDGLVAQLKKVFPQLATQLIPMPKPMDLSELDRLSKHSRSTMPVSSGILLLILVGVALALTIGATYLLSQMSQESTPSAQNTSVPTEVGVLQPVVTPDATALDVTSPDVTATVAITTAVATAEVSPSQAVVEATIAPSETLTPSRESTRIPSRTPMPSTENSLASPFLTGTVTREATLIPSRTRLVPTASDTPALTYTPSREATLIPSRTPTDSPTLVPTLVPTTYNVSIPAFDSTPLPLGYSNLRWGSVDSIFNGIEMNFVPAGCFSLLEGQNLNETCVDAFWISEMEITNAQYALCVEAGACTPPSVTKSRTHNSYFENPEFADYPVVNVTWMQATDFGRWFGGDLPSDVQWRYAAQGTSNFTFPWGEEAPRGTLLNYNGLIGDTSQVGSYPLGVSWIGAYDMAGNVWEWTSTAPSPSDRVICGGSWDSFAGLVRADYLATTPQDDANHYTGFRIALPVFPANG